MYNTTCSSGTYTFQGQMTGLYSYRKQSTNESLLLLSLVPRLSEGLGTRLSNNATNVDVRAEWAKVTKNSNSYTTHCVFAMVVAHSLRNLPLTVVTNVPCISTMFFEPALWWRRSMFCVTTMTLLPWEVRRCSKSATALCPALGT